MGTNVGKFFTIWNLDDPEHRREFESELGLPSQEAAVQRLAELVLAKCAAVVLEKEYIDLDFRKGYSRFHYMRHFDTPRRCKRLHFFGRRLNRDHLLRRTHLLQGQYLGYSVLRPMETYRIGRSVLSGELMPTAKHLGESYLTCKATFPVSLAGTNLTVKGSPYMEQDTLVSACASAALWMSSWYMAHRYPPEFKAFFTSEITDLATKYLLTGRAMPSVGLTIEQMLEALRQMGFQPLSMPIHDARQAKHDIYNYVESEIPVILAILLKNGDGHAITIVGHTFDKNVTPPFEELHAARLSLGYCFSSEFVPGFVVHDDSGGPYRALELVDPDIAKDEGFVSPERAEKAKVNSRVFAVIDRGSPSEVVAEIFAAIAPLPEVVTLPGASAETRSLAFLEQWWRFSPSRRGYRGAPMQARAIVRTFLQLSNELKHRMTEALAGSASLRSRMKSHLFARWVWVTEVSEYESFLGDELALGQIVQDSAGHPLAGEDFDLIYAQVPSLALLTYPDGGYRVVSVPDYSLMKLHKRPRH
jgi:hypothetical protein